MKICFLAPANSGHTKKWCGYFTSKGYDVHVVSFTKDTIDNVDVHVIASGVRPDQSDAGKLKYLLLPRKVGQIVKQINPDILSVHYATSYGTVAALANIGKYTLSVWGSDIYEFPQRSFLHRLMMEFSLKRASLILSTSKAMALETKKYSRKRILITPFGVDTDLFSPQKRKRKEDGRFVVGTVKTLDPKYGIDTILQAVCLIKDEHPEVPIFLRIAGTGSKEQEYKNLAKELQIEGITQWLGFISQQCAADEWANMDVAVIPSNAESFGVSAVEAQASGIPVIISDEPGLMEATEPGTTSVTIHKGNAKELADALIALYNDPQKRCAMGRNGREYVLQKYEYSSCFAEIERILNAAMRRKV